MEEAEVRYTIYSLLKENDPLATCTCANGVLLFECFLHSLGFAPVEPSTCITVTYVISLPIYVGAVTPPASCVGLDNIIANIATSGVLQCQRSDDCLSLNCNATHMEGFGAVLHFLHCDRPPAIELFSKTPLGQSPTGKFDSSDPMRTTVITSENGTDFEITISWITTQTASISVRSTLSTHYAIL